MTLQKVERQEKYWICDACASMRGWNFFKSGNTVIIGLCGWCERNDQAMLTPLRDLKNEHGVRADCEDSK